MVTWCIPHIYDPPTSDDGGAHAPIYVVTPCMCKATYKSACYVHICVIVDVIGICFIVL